MTKKIRHWVLRASSFILSLGLSCFVIPSVIGFFVLRHFAFIHESGEDAENRLELKERSEKVKLPLVKEKRSYKRFDPVSALAVFGVLLVLLFEGIFIFEFYRVDYSKIEPYLPDAVIEWLAAAAPERPVPVKPEPEPVEAEPVPAKQEAVLTEPEADQPAASVEEAAPAVAEKELVPAVEPGTAPTSAVDEPVSSEGEPSGEESEPVPVG